MSQPSVCGVVMLVLLIAASFTQLAERWAVAECDYTVIACVYRPKTSRPPLNLDVDLWTEFLCTLCR
jgi:hypothetical protein